MAPGRSGRPPALPAPAWNNKKVRSKNVRTRQRIKKNFSIGGWKRRESFGRRNLMPATSALTEDVREVRGVLVMESVYTAEML